QLIGAFTPTFMKPHLFMRLAVSHRPMPDTSGIFSVTAMVFKGNDGSHEWFFRRFPGLGKGIRENELFVFDDFEVDAPVRKFLAVWPAHHDEVGTARSHIKFDLGHTPWGRYEPSFQNFRVRPGAINLFLRRGNDACQGQFTGWIKAGCFIRLI